MPVLFLKIIEIVVAVFFTLTDRASTIPSNLRGGCQSGTWSAGQEKYERSIYKEKLQREYENKYVYRIAVGFSPTLYC